MAAVNSNLHSLGLRLQLLRDVFGSKLQESVPLARYTSARVGGPADAFFEANSSEELAAMMIRLWELGLPGEEADLVVLGGGSNLLISDAGVRGVVVLNRARKVVFDETSNPPSVWCESGANFGLVARQAAARGLAGLEWAAGIPGTVGGAVIGNAGAFNGDMAGNLRVAEILHQGWVEPGQILKREEWPVERMGYEYRSSLLKRRPGKVVVLSAVLNVEKSTPETVHAKINQNTEYRRRTQPPGASMGSMFKNPVGDYAGRLIEAAGLKGFRIGKVEISSNHANFFINRGGASAAELFDLIQLAKTRVAQKFGVDLELEIELRGQW
jgi:UDP-N-acetylmuramate dehydrogenase